MLRHFQEIEDRNLWTGAGSLYKYLERKFELTSDQIYPRLQAMRLMRAVPEVEQKLEDGQLSISNALKAQQVFSAESKERKIPLVEKLDVLERLSDVSTREASRHIQAEVKREMEKTRHLGCDHIDPDTGERCGSKHFLQMDHIHEYSQGGLNEVHNLHWLCGFHNRHKT